MPSIETRICNKCGKEKSITEFSKRNSRNRGVGYLQDDAELCLKAYQYLRKN